MIIERTGDPQPDPNTLRWRPRISLLTILLVMALAACAITIWQLWRDVGPLRQEVRVLRDQVGVLTIEDETKYHAIRVSSDSDFTWKWRVWAPPAKRFAVYWMWGDVPKNGVPKGGSWAWLNTGEEQLLTLSAKRMADGKSWISHLRTPAQVSILSVPPEAFAAPNSATLRGVENSTVVAANDGEPFVLGRYRVAAEGKESLLGEDVPLPGFIIWVQRK